MFSFSQDPLLFPENNEFILVIAFVICCENDHLPLGAFVWFFELCVAHSATKSIV